MEHGSGRYVPCSLFLAPCSRAERGRAARRGCWAARSVNTPRKLIRPPMAKTSSSGQVRTRRRLLKPRLTASVQAAAISPGTNQSAAKVEAAIRSGDLRMPRPRSPTMSHSRPAKPRIPNVRSATVAWLAFHRVRKALIRAMRVLRPRGSSSCSSSSVNSYTSSSTLVPRRRMRFQRSRMGSEGMLLHPRRQPAWPLRLERRDLLVLLERQGDLVEPVQQRVAPELVRARVLMHHERRLEALRVGHIAALQVHRQLVAGRPLRLPHDGVHLLLSHDHGHESVLEAVLVEDVREAGRDHRPNAVLPHRPHRVLPRRAATEVAVRDQDGGAAVALVVHDELRVGFAVRVAPVVEQDLAPPLPLDALKVAGRHYLVRVHVGPVKGQDNTGDSSERLHLSAPPTRGCPRSAPRSPQPRPSGGWPGACALPFPAAPRSCGWTWRRISRPVGGCPGSSPGTSSSRPPATRSRR